MQKISTLAVGAALLAIGSFAAVPARAQNLTPVTRQHFEIDFETDVDGNPLTADNFGPALDRARSLGLDINTNDPVNHPLTLFNSNCGPDFGIACSGGDSDLATGPTFGTTPQGNVLIIQEDPNSNIPDDNRDGGTINFGFARGITLEKLAILDFDDSDRGEGYIKAFTADGLAQEYKMSEGTLINTEFHGDNSLREYDFSALPADAITLLKIVFPGSGAISSVAFSIDPTISEPVPEPLTTLGLAASGAFLAAARQKRRQKVAG